MDTMATLKRGYNYSPPPESRLDVDRSKYECEDASTRVIVLDKHPPSPRCPLEVDVSLQDS